MAARKVALVTGSARGIGRAISEALGAAGCDIVLNYHRDEDGLPELVRGIESQGARVLAVRADVSSENDVARLFATIRSEFGRLDILVNNAGITRDKSFRKMTVEAWQEVLNVNLTGAFLCCQQAVPWMVESGSGRIINISSIIGQSGGFGQANYAAAKAGLLGLTKSLALECAKHNVTVNAICPGFIQTGMVGQIPESVLQGIRDRIPMRRLGKPEEVAELTAFLALKADYLTGAELNLNGGLFMG